MVCSYRGVIAWIAALSGLSVVQLEASSWPEEFVQRYEAHGLALLHTNEADWVQRTNEYGLRRPTRACPPSFPWKRVTFMVGPNRPNAQHLNNSHLRLQNIALRDTRKPFQGTLPAYH